MSAQYKENWYRKKIEKMVEKSLIRIEAEIVELKYLISNLDYKK